MIRQLYIIFLALHPARFRYRFAFEMLAIYDDASAHGSRLPLLYDGVCSLVRQWVTPYTPTTQTVSAGAGIPFFHSLEVPLPKRWHLVTGAALSLLLLSALTTLIGRDVWRPRISAGAFDWMPGLLAVDGDSSQASSYREFTFGVLDRDRDLKLSTAEMTDAPVMLRILERASYGRLRVTESVLVSAIFDQDRNLILSKAEISRSTAVLRGLDANRDGTLVPEEVIPAVLGAVREYGGKPLVR
jgi:hypothetical protein